MLLILIEPSHFIITISYDVKAALKKEKTHMQFYTKKHQYYCGIDLLTKIIYICLLDSDGKVKSLLKINIEYLVTIVEF